MIMKTNTTKMSITMMNMMKTNTTKIRKSPEEIRKKIKRIEKRIRDRRHLSLEEG